MSGRIDVRSLRKTYAAEGGTVVAVDDVSFSVEPGTVTGVLGPNGAGKTTMIKCLLGLVTPTSGSVTIDGVDVHDDRRSVYNRASATFEGARNVYWRLTPRENMDFFAALQGTEPRDQRDRRERILESGGGGEKADEPVRSLSRGMQQKVALACTLMRDTPVVFLDEPTLGLDVETERSLRTDLSRLFEDEDRTVLLSSHNMSVVEDLCDRALLLRDGHLVAHDDIDAILGTDETTTYRLRLEGDPPPRLRERIEAAFPDHDLTTEGDRTVVELDLSERERLLDLLSLLVDASVVPESLSHVEPSLEDVIVDLTTDSADDGQRLATAGRSR